MCKYLGKVCVAKHSMMVALSKIFDKAQHNLPKTQRQLHSLHT